MVNAKTAMGMFGVLLIGLFVIGIFTGVNYIGFNKLKEVYCEQLQTGNEFNNSVCLQANGSTVTDEGLDQIDVVQDNVATVLSLLALVIIVLIFAVVIMVARGFAKTSKG